jgi:hypothetical protein
MIYIDTMAMFDCNFLFSFSIRYKNLHQVVDQVFPPMDSCSASEVYSSFTFWRDQPVTTDSIEIEIREQINEIRQQQKSRGKGSVSSTSSPPNATVTSKSRTDKQLANAQATDTTVKKS